ncbi:MAG: hypothetical protein HOP22_12760 [Nitrospiraceae bacterium]|nr:hypothetical protein [Nitrospiraceae bacterium]
MRKLVVQAIGWFGFRIGSFLPHGTNLSQVEAVQTGFDPTPLYDSPLKHASSCHQHRGTAIAT